MNENWPRTMPKWLRGISKYRSIIIEKHGQGAEKHSELLNIHRPAISPQMAKYAKFILWFVKKHLTN